MNHCVKKSSRKSEGIQQVILLHPVVIRFFLMVLFFLFLPFSLMARETITWVNEDFPPAFILKGPDKGNGITDGAVSVYKKYMPQYDHKHLVANIARIVDMIKEEEKVCYAGFIKTPEREKFVQFSIPNIITYSNSLIVSKQKMKALFGDQKSISLRQLLEDDQLTIGLTKGRAYGEPIDSIIKMHINSNSNLFIRGGDNELLGLLNMIDHQRIDATIGYPWEVSYLANQYKRNNSYSVIHIQETVDNRWVLSYAGCPKNPWGRKVIEDLNAVLKEIRPKEEYLHHLLKWYPTEMEADIRQAYSEKILSVTE